MTDLSLQEILPRATEFALSLSQVGLRIGLIFLVGYLGIRFLKIALKHLESILIKAGEATEEVPGATRKRITTLTGVLQTVVVGIVWSVVIVVFLEQIGLDITPILAGAGIVGLAVGFGAQNLVRDIISGFFLILENQIRVGDWAIINGTSGSVETITFRTVVLRDLSAVVHVFPNGSIETLSNMTKDWSAYVIDAGVAYKEDTDRVIEVMVQVAEEIRSEPKFAPMMIGPIEIFGVDNFGESEVTIKARLRTHPLKQWAVGREYRRRLKKAFDAAGIEIPFPQRTLNMGEASPAFNLMLQERAGAQK